MQHEEWEGKKIAKQFAAHITEQWRQEGDNKSDVTTALGGAIAHFYGSKEAFFEHFLKNLNPEMLQQFYTLLYEYLRELNASFGGIDPAVLAAIREKLQKAGIVDVEQADASKSVTPSSSAGKSPYGRGGKRGGRY